MTKMMTYSMQCSAHQRNQISLRQRIVCLVLCAFLPLTVVAENADSQLQAERVIWRKSPIPVNLKVGEERLIQFPGSVSVGIPQQLQSVLRSQSINGTLFLMAYQPFTSTRLIVRSEQEGPLYVVDLSADELTEGQTPLPPVEVFLPEEDESAVTTHNNEQPPWGYVALTRFSAQQRYAPARLLSTQPGIVRVPVSQQPVELLRGGKTQATPVAAWRAGSKTVTAVQLVNQSTEPVVLDPRHLRGNWLAATFQHNRLLPAGSDADSTTLYLISDRPFELAL